MTAASSRPTKARFCLTVAGLDPSGGAGLSADLRVFRRIGLPGLSVATALTAQNTRGVRSVEPVSETMLRAQLAAVFQDFYPAAVKTGLLTSPEQAKIIAAALSPSRPPLVVDTVMKPTRGSRLVQSDIGEGLMEHLFPLAAVATPNRGEAGRLLGRRIRSAEQCERAARKLVPALVPAVVITGGDVEGERASDLFYDGHNLRWLHARKKETGDIHGTGCHFSALLAALLATGLPLEQAVVGAKRRLSALIATQALSPSGHMKILNS